MARQCHHCFKSDTKHNVAMRKCAGCERAYYCSRECQKANWRDHKAGCLAQRKTDPRAMALIERVEAYAKAHRDAIFTGTTQGLHLHRDVTRCQRFFIRLALVPAADSSAKASVSYTLEDASLVPMDHPRWSFVKEQYDMLRAAFDRSGGVGGVGFFVALFVDQSTGAEFLDPISFDQAGVDYLTDGWLWRGQIYKDLNHIPDRVPDADKTADELMRPLDLSSFSFTNPHFVEQILDPVACVGCGTLARQVKKGMLTCPRCKHMHYCSLACLLACASSHTQNCSPMAALPDSERQACTDIARFASSGSIVDLFESVALAAYEVVRGPTKSDNELLVIQLQQRDAHHLEHQFIVDRADTVPYRLIPNGHGLRTMFALHHEWTKEQRPDIMSTVADGWKVAVLSILFIEADTQAYFMHSMPFWPRTASWAGSWPSDWRHFLNHRINGSKEDEKLARSHSTCPCAKCVRARRA